MSTSTFWVIWFNFLESGILWDGYSWWIANVLSNLVCFYHKIFNYIGTLFSWSLGCSHGNISKGRVVLLPELCSLKKTKQRGNLRFVPSLSDFFPVPNWVGNSWEHLSCETSGASCSSSCWKCHKHFHSFSCGVSTSLLPRSARREMLKSTNHGRGWKETQGFFVQVVYLLFNLHFC